MVSKDKTQRDFEELLLEVRKVTRVTTGGRQMSFRAIIVVGNKKGTIGLGLAKGPDVSTAVQKASKEAYKNLFIVPITNANTVPYLLEMKYKSSRVRLLPASSGTGLKAGTSVRAVLSLAGYENILSKRLGSTNKLNNALATIKALSSYKYADHFEDLLDSKAEKKEQQTVTTTKKAVSTEKKVKKSPKKISEKKNTSKKPIKKSAEKLEENTAIKKISKGASKKIVSKDTEKKNSKKDLGAKLADKK